MPKALTIIRDDTAPFRPSCTGWSTWCGKFARNVRNRSAGVPCDADYLDTFAERVHHPKEDQYLFGILRQRSRRREPHRKTGKGSRWRRGIIAAAPQCLSRYEEVERKKLRASRAR